MCDYSLKAYKSRPAAAGERLTATRFRSGSVGFTGKPETGQENGATTMANDLDCAVCVLPGTTLLLEGLSNEIQKEFGVAASERAMFAKLDGDLYQDGVRFSNGKEILLQRLPIGMTAVISPPIDLIQTLKLDQPLAGLADDTDQARTRQPDLIDGDD